MIASLTVVAGATAPSGSVSAAPDTIVSATSPTTGITYTGRYSCMEQRPSFVASRPSRLAYVKLEGVSGGSVTYSQAQYVDNRDLDSRVAFDVAGVPRDNRSSATTFQLRDTFAIGQSPGAYGPVFLTIAKPSCPDYSAGARGSFTAIAPQRVLDTRAGKQVNYTGQKPAAGASIKVPAAVMPDRPNGVIAVSLTLTVTQPSRRMFAQVYPAGLASPGASSNVNPPDAGVTTANAAIVPVASDGSFSVYVNHSANVIVDINGYFVEAQGAVAAGRLQTIEPKRLLDTRASTRTNHAGGTPASGSTTTVDLTALSSGLPAGATAALVNVTVTRTTGAGYVQAAAAGELVPGTSSVLNATRPNQSVAGLSLVPLSDDGRIDLYTLRSADLIVDLIGWFTGEEATASESGLFVAIPPERIRDTRRATNLNQETFGGSGGCCSSSGAVLGYTGVGGLASAVVLNVTAIDGGTTWVHHGRAVAGGLHGQLPRDGSRCQRCGGAPLGGRRVLCTVVDGRQLRKLPRDGGRHVRLLHPLSLRHPAVQTGQSAASRKRPRPTSATAAIFGNIESSCVDVSGGLSPSSSSVP